MLDAAFLDQIETDIDAGLYLRVHPHVDTLIAEGGARGAQLAIRALRYLGCERQARVVAWRARRRYPQDPASAVAFIRQTLDRRGPYYAWQLCRQDRLHQDDCPAEERAEFLSLYAYILSVLRDFEQSEQLHEQVVQLAPHLPWLWVEWAYCCEHMDRYDEAMQATEEALRLSPNYRSAQQFKAHLMELAGKPAEAIRFLEHAYAHSECWGLGYQLYELQFEHGNYAGAKASLARISTQMPRADKWMHAWLAARRADLLMVEGQLTEAREEAAKVIGPGFYRNIVERLDAGVQAQRRVLLPVGFVRQHRKTCAPATLSALARYFGKAADHLEIAEEICYDGTSDYSERRWASENGFYAREFRVTWESAQALLDAGIPFTLTTVYSTGGHLQAVIGYDLLRGSLLIRDPFQPTHSEFDAEALFESHSASGPRGMVMIPLDAQHKLAGIPLPDAEPYDHYHQIVAALGRHERAHAAAALEQLKALAPEHRLCLFGERVLAWYDDAEAKVLSLTDALLTRYPTDINLQLAKATSLSILGERQKHIEYLNELTAQPMPDTQILVRQASTLAQDGRRIPEAIALLQRGLRQTPTNANVWNQLAQLKWQEGLREESLVFYRIAACLDEYNEYWSRDYASFCHAQGQTELGLGFLKRRVEKLGALSSAPAISLFEQLERLEKTHEAFATLDEALAQHPEDASLRLYAAETHLRYGRTAEAARYLGNASEGVARAQWLRVKSMLSEYMGQPAEALALIREACTLQPLNVVLHRTAARLLSSFEGRKAAIAYLYQTRDQYPLHYGLNQLLYDWLTRDSAEEETQLRHLAALYPDSAWAMRELAFLLVRRKQWDEAQQWVDAALACSPFSPASHGVLGQLQLERDGYAAAVPAFKAALRLDIDYSYALSSLLDRAPDKEAGLAAIEFIRSELIRQVTTGDALLDFQDSAHRWLSAEELLPTLREALDARPDLWQTWITYGSQLTRLGQSEAALEVFAQAVEKFPQLPRLFIEHAQALKSLGRRDDARAQAAKALEISPSWNRAVRLYVDTCTETGEHWAEAETALNRALARSPNDHDLRGLLGWLHAQLDRHEAAWEEAARTLRNDPSQQWVWDLAQRVANKLQRASHLQDLLNEIEQERPGDPWTWIARARLSNRAGEALAAAERATELAPELTEAWTARFDRLLQFNRHADIPPLLDTLQRTQTPAISVRVYACHAKRASGDKAGATDALQTLIEEAPYSYSLHRQLADWFDEDNNNTAYLATAQQLVQLAPNYAQAHGYLGHALTKLGRHADAIPALKRAFELDGEYLFAGRSLIEACLQEKQHEEALAAAHAVWRRYPRADIAAEATVAASALKHETEAEEWLSRTLNLAGYNTDTARKAYDAVVANGWQSMAHGCVERCIKAGACAHHAVMRWIETEHKSCRDAALVDKFSPLMREESGIALKMGLLSYAAKQNKQKILNLLLAKHAALLRQSDETWGQVSYAMQSHNRHADAQRWLNDWRQRPEAPGWALGNAALAHASLNKFEQIGEIAAQVLAREPDNVDAHLWRCADFALKQNIDGLADELAQQEEWETESWMKPLLAILQAYLDARQNNRMFAAVQAFRKQYASCNTLPSGKHLHRRLRNALLWHAPWWQKPLLLVALNLQSG